LVAGSAVSNAVTATPRYPADSFSPNASPRRAGPAKSTFITTVIDQASPWLTPSRTFATTIHHQVGARPTSTGTGRATSQPATSRRLRPIRPGRAPAARFVKIGRAACTGRGD